MKVYLKHIQTFSHEQSEGKNIGHYGSFLISRRGFLGCKTIRRVSRPSKGVCFVLCNKMFVFDLGRAKKKR